MPPGDIDFDRVREIGLELPDVEEGTSYRGPALKIRGKLLACQAINKSAEPNTLAVRVSFDERDRLLAADPDTYYVTDHYVDYPTVLVRLGRIETDALRELLQTGWRFVMEKA